MSNREEYRKRHSHETLRRHWSVHRRTEWRSLDCIEHLQLGFGRGVRRVLRRTVIEPLVRRCPQRARRSTCGPCRRPWPRGADRRVQSCRSPSSRLRPCRDDESGCWQSESNVPARIRTWNLRLRRPIPNLHLTDACPTPRVSDPVSRVPHGRHLGDT